MDGNLGRLRIAARIHFFLKRELGTGIDVETMLKRPSYAGEVLAMCDACKGTELERLAREFRVATARAERPAAPVPTTGWGDTSGFGLTQPLPAAAKKPSRAADHDEADDQAASPRRSSSPPSPT
jgi:hypothetical protein